MTSNCTPLSELSDKTWTDLAHAIESVQSAATHARFAARKSSGKNHDASGQFRRYDLVCSRKGSTAPSRKGQGRDGLGNAKPRSRSTAATGCDWKGKLTRSQFDNLWRFSFVGRQGSDDLYNAHNHDLLTFEEAARLPINRKAGIKPHIRAIEAAAVTGKLTSSEIAEQMRLAYPGLVIEPRDVENILADARRRKLARANSGSPSAAQGE